MSRCGKLPRRLAVAVELFPLVSLTLKLIGPFSLCVSLAGASEQTDTQKIARQHEEVSKDPVFHGLFSLAIRCCVSNVGRVRNDLECSSHS